MHEPHAAEDLTSSDETLAGRARDGSRASFAVLVERYQNRIYRLAFRMCRNPSDAEEITQEAFLLAHRGIRSFQGESLFRTWLYRIAINQALMLRRSARRRPAQPCGPSELADLAQGGAGLCDAPEGADALVDRKCIVQQVRFALACLEEPLRTAVVLRDLEGLSADESAAILGVSADAVRQRAHRGRLRLRELLAVPPVPSTFQRVAS